MNSVIVNELIDKVRIYQKQQDIDKILDNDSEFNYEKSFINSRIKNFTWLWALTIITLLIAILSVSELIGTSFYYK